MTRNQMVLQSLAREIERSGPTEDLLKRCVLALITEVTTLHRELSHATSMANRAEQQSRRMVYYR